MAIQLKTEKSMKDSLEYLLSNGYENAELQGLSIETGSHVVDLKVLAICAGFGAKSVTSNTDENIVIEF